MEVIHLFSKKYTLLNVRCLLATERWTRGKSLPPKWLDCENFTYEYNYQVQESQYFSLYFSLYTKN